MSICSPYLALQCVRMGYKMTFRQLVGLYLHFIEPNRAAIDNGLFKYSSMEQIKGWDVQLGYQFENLVVNHVCDLFRHLGIERSLVLSAAPYVQRGTRRGEGCQIDLLIQTRGVLPRFLQ